MSYSANFNFNKAVTNSELNINENSLRKAALVFRAINNKLRQRMLHEIYKHESITVSELYNNLNLEQSVASQHLAILRRADFVVTKRVGKYIYYSVNLERMKEIHDKAGELITFK